jgi:hypothetical protein
MRTILFLLIAIACITLSSCDKNSGYPKKAVFTRDGGTIELTSAKRFEVNGLMRYNGKPVEAKYSEIQPDTFMYESEWLTVKGKIFDYKLILEAKPNDTGKERKVYIDLNYCEDFPSIKVVQRK